MNGQESPRDLTSTLKQIKLACLLPNIQMQKAGEEVIYQGDASLPASDLERSADRIKPWKLLRKR